MSTKLVPRTISALTIQSLDDLQNMAKIFVASGLFDSSSYEESKGLTQEKKLAQACVKIQAGLEMGMQPFQAMNDIHIIKNKVTLGYQALAAKVRTTPGYDYVVKSWTEELAEIEFLRNGKPIGVSKFDIADMQRAGLGGMSWQKYRRNMLFARAMSNGVNTFCSEVCRGGAVYTPADFDVAEDASEEPLTDFETGEVLVSTPNESLDEIFDTPGTPVPVRATKEDLADLTELATLHKWAPDDLTRYCEKRYGKDFRKSFTQDMISEVRTAILKESALDKEEAAV